MTHSIDHIVKIIKMGLIIYYLNQLRILHVLVREWIKRDKRKSLYDLLKSWGPNWSFMGWVEHNVELVIWTVCTEKLIICRGPPRLPCREESYWHQSFWAGLVVFIRRAHRWIPRMRKTSKDQDCSRESLCLQCGRSLSYLNVIPMLTSIGTPIMWAVTSSSQISDTSSFKQL